ncbi:hypothetical protein HMPREF0628_0144 [Peptoniphilus lacrimalis 315-B]|uniref:Uncharacterized protein n=1 Tax=Peptoniphilus lacrimalis 315-B TaxID=596330 RepID=D1VS17_9FIRM|nr:hypothetical protein HMPREF0628_0144 [Peptoniphilus lacrimalis 315-B]
METFKLYSKQVNYATINVGFSVGLNKTYQKENKYFTKMLRHCFGL